MKNITQEEAKTCEPEKKQKNGNFTTENRENRGNVKNEIIKGKMECNQAETWQL